jgi:uncharacterized membrane protein YdbT with pleckstrin-like domain
MKGEGKTIDELCEILDIDSSTIKYLELPKEELSDLLREAHALEALENSERKLIFNKRKLLMFLLNPRDMILLPIIILYLIYDDGGLALTLITIAVFIGYVIYRSKSFSQAQEKVFTNFSNREELRDHLMSLAHTKQTLKNN